MTILNVKLKTLLSFIENKYRSDVVFQQLSAGSGSIIVYKEDSVIPIVSWANEDERESKLMEYIFLNRI